MNGSKFLYLVNGERSGQGFWKIGLTENPDPLKVNKSFLECYRKELIGSSASKQILNAINLNISSLLIDCLYDGYKIDSPPEGFPYDLPLSVLEEIYDFWLELYKDSDSFEKVVGLLKTRKKVNFSNPALVKGLKGFTGKWAKKIETLHSYRPPSSICLKKKDPMWKEF